MKYSNDILKLIISDFINKISLENEKLLKDWINESQENKLTYKETIKLLIHAKDTELVKEIDEVKAWAIINRNTTSKKQKIFRLNFYKYAAAILIPVLLSGMIYYLTFYKSNNDYQKAFALLENMKPGTQKAILTLSDGQKLFLENRKQNKVLLKNDFREIKDSSNILVYKSIIKSQNLEKMNNVYVPRGGEYKVILSDGTKVWLNSDTKFEFPMMFVGNKRVVALKGEAFFEVAKDKTKPFIVKTKGVDVEVLGTSFNISAYEKDDNIRTTLVEGSVKVISSTEEMLLTPGFQSEYSENKLVMKEIDTDLYTTWKDGVFKFENIRLHDLTTKLGRWYNVDFFFDNDKLKELKFNGAVKRDKPLSVILNILRETNYIDYDVNTNTILIKN
jgi:ferric-dicitrate binding protein FerR (iron transport regulator)